ncbi:thioesterase II family protein [Amycolatopsis coloradensis]|uniref:thioesterase II family protein n=1 Tax=Amycolatopsis coloradensis TaxID=76021 RepID=UPI001ABF428D|nr:alpha/beta fold hydrolase [Amycolatopsis coloradensis]
MPAPAPGAGVRLVCCPHAGASAAAFAAMAVAVPSTIEALCVEYPGRGGKRGAGIGDIGEVADRICAEVLDRGDVPVAVYGHSMGAAVAFEVTWRLEQEGAEPTRLFVSGRKAPSTALELALPGNEDIVAELRALGGIPPRILGRPAFRDMIVSVVRNDYRANLAYRAAPERVVRAPITFLLAAGDPYVDVEAARAWTRHTSAELRVTRFPGDHFFLRDHLAEIVDEIVRGVQVRAM